MSIQTIVIIIPTYNEEAIIQQTIAELAMVHQDRDDIKLKVLIFDSASNDQTVSNVKALQKIYPWLHLKTEEKKTGLGSAYLQAMRFAISNMLADVVIEFDADLSHQPKYLETMFELIKTHDVVVGSRYISTGSIPSDWGWHRKILSIGGNHIARLLLTRRYKDFTSGFRATKTLVLKPLLTNNFLSNDYAYKLHLFWMLHQKKANICEFPIEFVDRTKGKSKLPKNNIIDSLRVLIILRARQLFNRI